MAAAEASVTDDMKPMRRNRSFPSLPPDMSEVRVVLLGNSWSERSSVGNFILEQTIFNTEEEPGHCQRVGLLFKDTKVVLINTPDLLHPNISANKVSQHVKDCVRLSDPGPHVFLLVLQPEDFTEELRGRLCRVLDEFSDQSLNHSLVLTATQREERSGYLEKHKCMQGQPLQKMMAMCGNRCLKWKNLQVSELLKLMGQTVKANDGQHVCCDVSEDQDGGLVMSGRPVPELMKPALNLVLCGRRGAGKTSAANAILGQTAFRSVFISSRCVQHQAEVCGRRLSLVKLPALYGKPQDAVMEESFRCVSLCDPEGVHAFILVLPVDPLTDEDKGELETIWNTFSCRVNDFTMILFTVESDPAAPAVFNFVKGNKDLRELLQSCGGRHVVLNIKNKQQIPQLMDVVEKMRVAGSRSFTKDMFTKAQMQTVTRLRAELQDVKRRRAMGGDDESQSRERLRMVLIGMSGSGKSSTANTILGKKHFKPRVIPKPVTRFCERATGEMDGRPVAVVNTPPLFDSTLSDDEIQQEIKKCISMLSPGPHVFLLVLKIGHFAQEEKASVELIRKVFGKKSEDFIIIIFTGGDELIDLSIETYIRGCDDFVRQLISGGRYQVFNNKDDTNCTQVKELLTKIEAMVTQNGGCYNTLEFMQIQEERISMEREEEMKRKVEDLKRKHEEELKTLKRKINQQGEEIEDVRKLRAKLQKEKDECINKERQERKREREEEERRRKKQEESLRQESRKKLEASEKILQSERAQKESAERKLEQHRKEMKRERDAWDKEKNELWEQRLEEEKQNSLKVQHEYNHKRRRWTQVLFAMSNALVILLCFILFVHYYILEK